MGTRIRNIASLFVLFFMLGAAAYAATTTTQSFVPLIGVTSVPSVFTLPAGGGEVTYRYAVKNFLKEAPLTSVRVLDNNCDAVVFIDGDTNQDARLDNEETWRYSCTTRLSGSTKSVVTASGLSGDLHAAHNAYTTVVVGSAAVPPLIGIINITKVAYPLSVTEGGGDITFTYRVNNPGLVPLSDVKVVDDKCREMSGKLGDTNANNLLDLNEVWVYHCKARLDKTTTNTVRVTAFAGNMRAVGTASITVTVEPSAPIAIPFWKMFYDKTSLVLVATLLVGIALLSLLVFFYARMSVERKRVVLRVLLLILFTGGVMGSAYNLYFEQPIKKGVIVADGLFGWKFPITKFPITGPGDLAYSAIRDPGGIPSGLPVRLKIPIIGVDSAIEDALITKDGRMDVPAGSVDVAWFALGPHPGNIGSAVIGGHFGIDNGVKFVFYDLDKLKVGDKVFIEDDKGEIIEFVVREVKLFDRNSDATTVFASSDGVAHLNLITCEGIWNQVNGGYPKRRVVFADAFLHGGQPATSGRIDLQKESLQVLSKDTFQRTLKIGNTGIDVAALQSALESRNLLTIAPGVAKGYFGTLTRAAVIQYQINRGLTPTGIFDEGTRVLLIAEAPAVEPKFPIAGIPGVFASSSISFTSPGNLFTSTGEAFARFLRGMLPVQSTLTILILLLSVLGFTGVLLSIHKEKALAVSSTKSK